MLSITVKPSVPLAAFIDYYWVFECSDITGINEQFVYPQGSSELMFHYETPFTTKSFDGKEILQTDCFLSTKKLTSIRVNPSGRIGLVSVYFKPFGASAFFDLPANSLNEMNIDLGCFVGDKYKSLMDEIASAPNYKVRIDVIERYLLKIMNLRNLHEFEVLSKAVELINTRRGLLSVDSIINEACISGRHLDRLFVKRIRLSPKQYMRIRKLNFAISLMEIKKKMNLTQVALESGYYDQSHFTNDFKAITGLPPKEFIKLIG